MINGITNDEANSIGDFIGRVVKLNLPVVGNTEGELFCEDVIHHSCKYFDDIVGCHGCLVKKYEPK